MKVKNSNYFFITPKFRKTENTQPSLKLNQLKADAFTRTQAISFGSANRNEDELNDLRTLFKEEVYDELDEKLQKNQYTFYDSLLELLKTENDKKIQQKILKYIANNSDIHDNIHEKKINKLENIINSKNISLDQDLEEFISQKKHFKDVYTIFHETLRQKVLKQDEKARIMRFIKEDPEYSCNVLLEILKDKTSFYTAKLKSSVYLGLIPDIIVEKHKEKLESFYNHEINQDIKLFISKELNRFSNQQTEKSVKIDETISQSLEEHHYDKFVNTLINNRNVDDVNRLLQIEPEKALEFALKAIKDNQTDPKVILRSYSLLEKFDKIAPELVEKRKDDIKNVIQNSRLKVYYPQLLHTLFTLKIMDKIQVVNAAYIDKLEDKKDLKEISSIYNKLQQSGLKLYTLHTISRFNSLEAKSIMKNISEKEKDPELKRKADELLKGFKVKELEIKSIREIIGNPLTHFVKDIVEKNDILTRNYIISKAQNYTQDLEDLCQITCNSSQPKEIKMAAFEIIQDAGKLDYLINYKAELSK